MTTTCSTCGKPVFPHPYRHPIQPVDVDTDAVHVAWADYRSQYGVNRADLVAARKAFIAGWEAANGKDEAGPLR
ncbi:hypothetical protein [Nocardia asiatica]|uniref:hypothetical protein n=1 Tax=Nocardia asiatica TaxID=209252 RepID=UPI0024565215|nr:hypothetical protein [Nocardia asiatica]